MAQKTTAHLLTTERILKAFANRRRLSIVRTLLQEKEQSVGDLAEAIRLSFKSTSKHLTVLLAAGIVEREQHAPSASYRLTASLPSIAQKILSSL